MFLKRGIPGFESWIAREKGMRPRGRCNLNVELRYVSCCITPCRDLEILCSEGK